MHCFASVRGFNIMHSRKPSIVINPAVMFFLLLLWRQGVEWDFDAIADVDNGWGKCIVPIGSEIYAYNVRFDSRRILSNFLNYLYSML